MMAVVKLVYLEIALVLRTGRCELCSIALGMLHDKFDTQTFVKHIVCHR